jgi:hypothetical protein
MFCQVQYISKTISDRYVTVEVYDAQKGILSILYWLDDSLPFLTPYRITIEKDETSPLSSLVLRHHPHNCMLPTLDTRNGQVLLTIQSLA